MGEWVEGKFDTMVANNSDIGIKFMSGTKNHKIIFYIDDVSVKEVR